jgi:hypothetical protein
MIEPDRKRLDNSSARVIRGLYFIEMKWPLPEHGILKVASKAGLTADHPGMLTIACGLRAMTYPETASILRCSDERREMKALGKQCVPILKIGHDV